MSRFLILLAFAFVPFSAFAQQPKVMAPHDPIAPKVSKPINMKAAALGSIAGGPWIVDANFKSTIYLKNIVETSPITVTPVLHLSNGTKYQLPVVQLQAAGTAALDVNASLQALGIAPYATLSGWIELQYTWAWVPLCAVIRDIDVTHSLIFTFGYEAPGPASSQASQPASQVADGLWWKQESNVTGFLTLANTTPQPIKALVQVSDSQAKVLGTYNVTISPEGMKTLNLQELQSAPSSEGGIRVSYVGQPEALLINGGLQDANVGYSAGLRFAPPVRPTPPMSHVTTQQGIAEVGLMAGAADPMMHFPVGTTFTPYSVLHNTSTAPLSITPTLWWMQAGNASSFHLPQFTMLPSETRTLDLLSSLTAAGLKNFNGSFNIVFDTQGNSGLLIAGGSVDQTNTYVFEVASRGIVNSAGKSLSYWSTGNGDDTMVMLWNPADEEQNLIFRVMFAGGHYDYPIQLGPRATRTFNISDVINSQIPDAQGNTVPAGIQEGSAVIVGDQADNQNILLVMDSGVYNVRKATCGGSCQNCDGVTSASVSLNPFGVAVSNQWQENLTAQYCSGSQYNLSSQSNWSSSNTSLATVQSGLVHGVSPGSLYVSAGNTTVPVCAPQCNPYGSCPAAQGTGGSAPGCVGGLTFNGTANNFIFVGTDDHVVSNNAYYLQLTSGTPTGGTYSATSSDANDVLTISDFVGMKKVTVKTTDQSTSSGDRTLTFKYTPPSCAAMTLTKTVTARKFAYLTNNSPANNCNLAYGTDRTYIYAVHTHPGTDVVDASTGSWSGTPATESFNPSLTCTTITGNGSLDVNGELSDHVSSACSTQPLTCSQTTTQSIGVTGTSVRSNALQWSSTGVSYTNNGPTQ